MNHILHNISLLILLIGIIMLTTYITKANNQCNVIRREIIKDSKSSDNYKRSFDVRPKNEFKKMFDVNSPWVGYAELTVDQDLDPNK